MKENLSRRDFGKLLIASAASGTVEHLVSSPADAKEHLYAYHIVESELAPKELEEQKTRAIKSLVTSIPPDPHVSYLHQESKHLSEESQMYIPSRQEISYVAQACTEDVRSLSQKIEVGKTGLLLFADILDNKHFQRLYVLRKRADGNNHYISFEKAYKVSAARNGFGNEDKSNKTPLGLRPVLSGRIGMFGEVVTAVEEDLSRIFTSIVYNGKKRYFVKNFGRLPTHDTLDARIRDKVEVVTDRYTIDEQRGIHIHGTNRSGAWDEHDGRWISLLDGRRRSSGCIRMSNTDIRDLGLSGYIWYPGEKDGSGHTHKTGTLVAIAATPSAKGETRDLEGSMYGTDRPKRRVITDDNAADTKSFGYTGDKDRDTTIRKQPQLPYDTPGKDTAHTHLPDLPGHPRRKLAPEE